jgi:hypothetical protein
MWVKLDDELYSHPKLAIAGRLIGKNGGAIALGFYAASLIFANKHLTDGFLAEDVLLNFPHADQPLVVAGALARAGLFEKVKGGFQIHDYHEYNPAASAIRTRRKEDRLRKQREKARANGHA